MNENVPIMRSWDGTSKATYICNILDMLPHPVKKLVNDWCQNFSLIRCDQSHPCKN